MSKEPGRPLRAQEDIDRSAEIERLLVEGELVTGADGKQTRVYAKSSEIAARLNVSKSWISKFAHKHKCFQRRAEFQAKVRAKVTEQLIEKEADRIAFDTQKQLEFCDEILGQYREAIKERGVGNVTSTDINNLIRLRRLLQGEADSRQEVHNGVTLEMMEAAHQNLMRAYDSTSAAERGYSDDEPRPTSAPAPPARPFEAVAPESQLHPEVDPKVA